MSYALLNTGFEQPATASQIAADRIGDAEITLTKSDQLRMVNVRVLVVITAAVLCDAHQQNTKRGITKVEFLT